MEGRAAARPDMSDPAVTECEHACLQWRAGQLPGLTRIDRSDALIGVDLQWRAGQLPGLTEAASEFYDNDYFLQWRAGQLPGLTPSGCWAAS